MRIALHEHLATARLESTTNAINAALNHPALIRFRAEMKEANEMAEQIATGPSLYELLFPV
jgi:hypothetical protein